MEPERSLKCFAGGVHFLLLDGALQEQCGEHSLSTLVARNIPAVLHFMHERLDANST